MSNHNFILDNLTTAILQLDQQLCVQYMNSAAEVLLQISDRRVQGRHISALFAEQPDNIKVFEEAIAKAQPYTKRKTRLYLPHGQEIVVDYALTPVTGTDKPCVLLELQPLDRMLRISREASQASTQSATKTLLRSLAHEVKNPLGGIRGSAQLLAKMLPGDEYDEFTDIIVQETDRLRNLVDRMLGPSVPPKLELLNIHKVLERVVQLVTVESEGKIELSKDYDPSIPDLWGDYDQLIQAFLNIARNAMQALQEQIQPCSAAKLSFRSRAVRQFTVGERRHRLVVRVDVSDSGPGIDPELQETLFYPLITGRASGTGLGLSIAQSIMTRHQGLIECESAPGHTVFSLYIPLEQLNE